MKSYIVSTPAGRVDAFYDPHLRLWTAFLIDSDGHQAADAGYGMSKADAAKDAQFAPKWDDSGVPDL